MKKSVAISVMLFAFVGPLWQCKTKYVSPYVSPNVGYLVVEGFISGNTPIKYTLSRTLPLPGDSTIPPEKGAEVEVEGNDNSIYRLIEQNPGVYSSPDTPGLNPQAQYRLRIHTTNGEDYLSDFVPFKPSPPIDSVNWVRGPEGVTIFANTHDGTGSSRYYQWEFDETWQYNSAEYSYLTYDSTDSMTVFRNLPADQIFTCWHELPSSTIILGNSIKLAQDVIYEQPLEQFPTTSQKLAIRYTTLVHQWVLTDSAYNYASIMQKNTETLGSIFDAQPSGLVGNIHCLTKPGEQVVGYISAGTIQQQRIWISVSQLQGWNYVFSCPEQDLILSSELIQYQDFYYGSLTPIIVTTPPAKPGITANQTFCVDCRAQGGKTYPPPFWTN